MNWKSGCRRYHGKAENISISSLSGFMRRLLYYRAVFCRKIRVYRLF